MIQPKFYSHYPTLAVIEVRESKKKEKERQKDAMYKRFLEEQAERKKANMKMKEEAREMAKTLSLNGHQREESRSKKVRERKKRRMEEKVVLSGEVLRGRASVGAKKAFRVEELSEDSDSEEVLKGVSRFRGTKTMEARVNCYGNDCEAMSEDEGEGGRRQGTVPEYENGGAESDDEAPEEVKTIGCKEVLGQPEGERQEKCENPPPPPPPSRIAPQTRPVPPAPLSRVRRSGDGNKYGRLMAKAAARGPPTLLERLLKQEIAEERSELLQCVKYICKHNFFDDAKDDDGDGGKPNKTKNVKL